MIKRVTFEKILKKLKEKNISRYRLVDAKRDTKSYDEYYRDDPLRFSNSPFESIMKGKTISWENLIKYMNLFETDNIYNVISLWDENGNEVVPEVIRNRRK